MVKAAVLSKVTERKNIIIVCLIHEIKRQEND